MMPLRVKTTPDKSLQKDANALYFVPLGGLEEVGRNMAFFEYRNEIVIIDMGFQFPEEETPGVDYIIPNINYLKTKKENIRAAIITHGHFDHIGAIPYIIEELGNPPIYCTLLAKHIIQKRQEEFPNAPKLRIETITNWQEVEIGNYFKAQFFGVEHNIPETTGVILKTPVGNMVHFADFKIKYNAKGEGDFSEVKKVAKIGVHTLFLDSTNAEHPGRTLSEEIVVKNLEQLFKNAKGRIIVGIFASLLDRIVEIINVAEKLGRKVAISGRSMKTNIQIAQNLNYLKTKKDTIIPIEEMNKYKDHEILVLSTGAQGEPNASLMRMANGEHKYLQVKPNDTIIFSASAIPGNERSIQTLTDNLVRQGAKVIRSNLVNIHSSGHAPQEDLKDVIKITKPKFLVPVHGYYFMRATMRELGEEVGVPMKNSFLLDNGRVCKITKDKFEPTSKTVDTYYVMVDGLGIGDVGEVVLRDRVALSQEGMIVVIVTLDKRSGRTLKNPDIISRGFIYLKENKELVEGIRSKIKGIVNRIPRYQPIDSEYLKSLLRDQLGQFVYNKTQRRPMILPVVIEI